MQTPATPNPYSAPAFDASSFASATEVAGPYQSQADRVTLIAVLLGVLTVTHLASMWSCLAANEIVPAVFSILEPREVGAEGIDVLFVFSTLAYLICVIAIGAFLVRANKNARALGGESAGMSISPGWTVGWYFVPIFNLFKPYQAVREMWTVSQPAGSDRLPIWWALWIVMSLGARLLDKYFERAETWEDITRANYLSLAHSLVSIGAAVAVFFVVRGLHEIQQRHCNEGRPLMPGM